jgi:hypothetical protein
MLEQESHPIHLCQAECARANLSRDHLWVIESLSGGLRRRTAISRARIARSFFILSLTAQPAAPAMKIEDHGEVSVGRINSSATMTNPKKVLHSSYTGQKWSF